MRIKIDKADVVFSLFIRLRDKMCVKCKRLGDPDKEGRPVIGLQCSHFFGRAKESTRFDPLNCDSLCMGCHMYWGSTDREAYREFKIKQLGKKQFDLMVLRANRPITISRKDYRFLKHKEFKEMIK